MTPDELMLAIVTGLLALKGVAAFIVNNAPTQKWGKIGAAIEWLASANKESKKTGDAYIDSLIKAAQEAKPTTIVGKILKALS